MWQRITVLQQRTFLFTLESLSSFWYLEKVEFRLASVKWGMCIPANYIAVIMKSQWIWGSDFHSFICSLFPRTTFIDFIFKHVIILCLICNMSRGTSLPTKLLVRPAKIQISSRIHLFQAESLSSVCTKLGWLGAHRAQINDSDQSAHLSRLIWVIACLACRQSCRKYCTTAHVFIIMKTGLFKYIENFTSKNWKFSDKNSDIFHSSAQNIDCEYSLEPPRRGGSNEYP